MVRVIVSGGYMPSHFVYPTFLFSLYFSHSPLSPLYREENDTRMHSYSLQFAKEIEEKEKRKKKNKKFAVNKCYTLAWRLSS